MRPTSRLYSFVNSAGGIVSRWVSTDKTPPLTIKEGNDVYVRRLNSGPVTSGNPWPMDNFLCGINPNQVKSANAKLEALGIRSKWNKKGEMKHEDRNHYNEFLKGTGRFNRDAGYGDWAGSRGNHEINERLQWAKQKSLTR